jgi:small nuclear ribonucleoprotein (snRNP)-like protein
VTLKTNVLPWLFDHAEKYVNEISSLDDYPNLLLKNNIAQISTEHQRKITDHNTRKQEAAEAAQKALEARLAAKEAKKRAKEAAKRAEEIA